jgi:hypothetical protein
MAYHFAIQSPASITQYLADVDFPASKQEVLWSAQLQDAQDDILNLLRRIPNQQYTNVADHLGKTGIKRLASSYMDKWLGSRTRAE